MGRSVTFLAVLLSAFLTAAQTPPPPGFPTVPGLPQQPPRDNATAPPATAILRGHVYDASNGQPLRKVQVRAFSPELRENRLSITDNGGAYEIKNLPAGRFQLTATKGSFVSLSYGQTRPFEPGKPLEINDAQVLEKVDFRLPHGAIVTGRIVDEVGEPASDVQVTIQRYQYLNGRRQLVPARFAQTNDIGEYRLFGIPPGQYVVQATWRGAVNFNDAPSDDRSGYAPTYYPGTANVNEAQRITLTVGRQLDEIDIALTPTRLARISGSAVTSEGKPVSGMILLAQTSGAMMISSIGGALKPDGSFSIPNVAPGDYIVRVLVSNGPFASATGTNEVVQANVTVAGDDVTDVRLAGVKPSHVTGRIISPLSRTGAGPALSGLQIAIAPKIPAPLASGNAGHANDDGSFELLAPPGPSLIRMNPIGQFAGTRIKAVRLNGLDITDTGFDIRPNEDVSGVEIELTTTLSSVSGVVTDARGDRSRDYTVVIFPRDRELWGPGSRYLNLGRPDQDGRYKAVNLPPGDYYAIALDYVEQGANTDPEFLDRIRDRATGFSMTEGETKSLDLRLVTGI